MRFGVLKGVVVFGKSLQTIKGRDKMTDITTVSSSNGTTDNSANGAAANTNGVDVKDPSAVLAKNKELLELIRKEKQSKVEMQQKLQEIEQAKLQAEGKKDELITQLQAQMKQIQTEFNKTKATYAFTSVKNQAALKAKELGCIDTDLLLKAMDLDSLQVNVVDDSFNVDHESLTTQLEQVRKTKPFLFKQAGPTIKDGVPSTQSMQKTGEVDFNKMTTAQLIEYAKKNADKIK